MEGDHTDRLPVFDLRSRSTTPSTVKDESLPSPNLGGSYIYYSGQLTPDVGIDFATKLSDNFGLTLLCGPVVCTLSGRVR